MDRLEAAKTDSVMRRSDAGLYLFALE